MKDLAQHFLRTRRQTEALTEGLSIEDYGVQSMPDASPVKWHLAHTTWFFETFVLAPNLNDYRPRDPAYAYLFNSYYEAVGPQWPRAKRGTLSRPTVAEVKSWRAEIDERIVEALGDGALDTKAQDLLLLGVHHEQQHQELLVTDLKHALAANPLDVRVVAARQHPASPPELGHKTYAGGLVTVGHEGPGFCFDNEGPAHQAFLPPFRLAQSLVTCGQYLEFIEDGGYRRPELWLSDAWFLLAERGWTAPLYWRQDEGAWTEYTLAGRQPVRPHAPVCHLSFFEADAYARWKGQRLPTEAEWEHAARSEATVARGTMLEDGVLHPVGAPNPNAAGLHALLGEVWEWTASPYRPYPGYRPAAGAVGEYNGKFMNGQYVLRGGSCATPQSHIRLTYRNFFPPDKRWNFMGLRLADDAENS